jgi:hypothetical protein
VYSATGEGTFFEHGDLLEDGTLEETAANVLRRAEGAGVEIPSGSRDAIQRYMLGDPGKRKSGRDLAERMYARCMDWVAREHGASRWAQKATSYIFYIDDILACFPDARLLFMARNPFDLAASMKRRGVWSGVARMAYGWNKGVRRALQAVQDHPQNARLIRYEEFVRDSEQEMTEICSFCDLSFHPELLEIPHVNRSESPYNQSSRDEGISGSRLGYFRDTLTEVEIAAVRSLSDEDVVGDLYPEVLADTRTSLAGTSYAAVLGLMGAMNVGNHHLRALMSNPRHVVHRVKKRMSA